MDAGGLDRVACRHTVPESEGVYSLTVVSCLMARREVVELFAHALKARQCAGRDPSVGIHALRLAEQLRAQASKEPEDDEGHDRPQ